MFAESQTFATAQILLSLLLEMFMILTVFVMHVVGTNMLVAICETFVINRKEFFSSKGKNFFSFFVSYVSIRLHYEDIFLSYFVYLRKAICLFNHLFISQMHLEKQERFHAWNFTLKLK